MAQNCNGTVTPAMIRNGQMQIGDTIQLEEFIPQQNMHAQASQPQQNVQSRQSSPARPNIPPQISSRNSNNFHVPLGYEEITPYMDQVTLDQVEESMSLNIPQTPLSTEMFSESLDVTDVQQYTGFLRTQIGRYMRIEQLIGSDTIRDRYGYLVGVGSNFIILQEVLTGNIMIVDLFSIRLTYIYYADAAIV